MNKSIFHFNIPVILVPSLFIFYVSCTPFKDSSRKKMSIVSYNVENLFDTENTSGKRDGEFTPQGKYKWDESRYKKKLNNLSRVIGELNESDLPEIVGLCEVENEQVVVDLVQTGRLAVGNYRVIHHESPDSRGIDCALIYRPDAFTVLYHEAIPVTFSKEPGSKTRDILYVKGHTNNREEFHVFVNHWPSRIGGVSQTEFRRKTVAAILKDKIDSIGIACPKAHVVVLGDLNDEPNNKSLMEVLNAYPPLTQGAKLINLMFPQFLEGKGSYFYRGTWSMLDNIIVSPGLLDSKGWRITSEKGFIYRENWMEYTDSGGRVYPNRSYKGSDYNGGISDHFPVYIKLQR